MYTFTYRRRLLLFLVLFIDDGWIVKYNLWFEAITQVLVAMKGDTKIVT